MNTTIPSVSSAYLQDLDVQATLLHQHEQVISGSVKYAIARLQINEPVQLEDANMLVYHYSYNDAGRNYLELRYCMQADRYCAHANCNECKTYFAGGEKKCGSLMDVFTFRFSPEFLSVFTQNTRLDSQKDEVLAFRHKQSFSRYFSLCSKKRAVLQSLQNHPYTGSMENIFVNAKIHELLLYSLECLAEEKEQVFACRFLSNEQDREKIMLAKEILLQHIGDPITIKELSRKVAINECYLKKGFKAIFGTTIFDFYQQQRMEHARYLLYNKGLSVTEVSLLLGYSSISHFSTAFKKHTGIKPCELLYAGA